MHRDLSDECKSVFVGIVEIGWVIRTGLEHEAHEVLVGELVPGLRSFRRGHVRLGDVIVRILSAAEDGLKNSGDNSEDPAATIIIVILALFRVSLGSFLLTVAVIARVIRFGQEFLRFAGLLNRRRRGIAGVIIVFSVFPFR